MLKDSVVRDDLGVTDTVNAEKFYKDIRAPFIDGLLDNSQARFQDVEVIEHLAVVDLTGAEGLPTLCGLTEIEALAEHFKLDTAKLLGQWEDYLQLVCSMETVDRSLANLVNFDVWWEASVKGAKGNVSTGGKISLSRSSPSPQHSSWKNLLSSNAGQDKSQKLSEDFYSNQNTVHQNELYWKPLWAS